MNVFRQGIEDELLWEMGLIGEVDGSPGCTVLVKSLEI